VIFSEWNGAYYNAVAGILKAAADHPVTKEEMRRIIDEQAFSESILSIEPSLSGGKWQLLKEDGTAAVRYPPTMPLTLLMKRWLKSISLDPRIRLFDFHVSGLEEIPPLFTKDDIYIFDQYADGDPYEDPLYTENFHRILEAVRNHSPLSLEVMNRRNNRTRMNVMPEYLEYSEKDDKFRLFTSGCRYGSVVNLSRIISCRPFHGDCSGYRQRPPATSGKRVVIELLDERNTLERVMLHFAHFEKEAERIDEKHYRVTIRYSRDDETEMVIRILSFGPFIRVTEPAGFVNLIKKRLRMQKSCELQ